MVLQVGLGERLGVGAFEEGVVFVLDLSVLRVDQGCERREKVVLHSRLGRRLARIKVSLLRLE